MRKPNPETLNPTPQTLTLKPETLNLNGKAQARTGTDQESGGGEGLRVLFAHRQGPAREHGSARCHPREGRVQGLEWRSRFLSLLSISLNICTPFPAPLAFRGGARLDILFFLHSIFFAVFVLRGNCWISLLAGDEP